MELGKWYQLIAGTSQETFIYNCSRLPVAAGWTIIACPDTNFANHHETPPDSCLSASEPVRLGG